MPHHAIPPERPHLAPLRPLASARTTQHRLHDGQLVLTIEHATLRGLSPQMLRWWFENIGGTMRHQGRTWPRYLLWHPRDHIHWELAAPAPGGGARQGARFRIVEAFDARPEWLVDSTECVERLDDTGITLVRRILGHEVFRLEHRFGEAPGGASYRSRMVVGAARGWLKPVFNGWVRPRVFSDAMGSAWLKHNVEEVGLLEALLPALYAVRPAACAGSV
jgi:hypothetical protein